MQIRKNELHCIGFHYLRLSRLDMFLIMPEVNKKQKKTIKIQLLGFSLFFLYIYTTKNVDVNSIANILCYNVNASKWIEQK